VVGAAVVVVAVVVVAAGCWPWRWRTCSGFGCRFGCATAGCYAGETPTTTPRFMHLNTDVLHLLG